MAGAVDRAQQLRETIIEQLQAPGREADALAAIDSVDRLITDIQRISSAAAEAVHAYREQGPTDTDTLDAITALGLTVEALDGDPEDKVVLLTLSPHASAIVARTLRAAIKIAAGLGHDLGFTANEENVRIVTAAANQLDGGA